MVALTGIERLTLQIWPDLAVLTLLFSDLAARPMVHRGRCGALTVDEWLTEGPKSRKAYPKEYAAGSRPPTRLLATNWGGPSGGTRSTIRLAPAIEAAMGFFHGSMAHPSVHSPR